MEIADCTQNALPSAALLTGNSEEFGRLLQQHRLSVNTAARPAPVRVHAQPASGRHHLDHICYRTVPQAVHVLSNGHPSAYDSQSRRQLAAMRVVDGAPAAALWLRAQQLSQQLLQCVCQRTTTAAQLPRTTELLQLQLHLQSRATHKGGSRGRGS